MNLSPPIQQKLSTAEGPAGVGTLSKLAELFPPEKQERALQEIKGFNQHTQFEILKRSGDDISQLSTLKDQALERSFSLNMCADGFCFAMDTELKSRIKSIV